MISGEQKVFLDAVGHALRKTKSQMEERLRDFSRITFPSPVVNVPPPLVRNEIGPTPIQVTNEVDVPQVIVHVDMAPVAAALDRMTAALTAMADSHTERDELLRQLLVVLADQPRPLFRPILKMEAPQVTVEAPSVTVTAEQAQRPKRSLTIKHGDGSTSTVYED